ncbi:hypothetical protein MP638_004618 [Amoeboaphelidium occidentale]|nr:hypothetical protein MP638_004618 [Amoeboaphelidium occidentale]
MAEHYLKTRSRFLPLCNYQQRHIPIDSGGLQEILKAAGFSYKFASSSRDSVYDNPDLYWRSLFSLEKIETFYLNKTPSRRFAYSITTDGIQVGINVLKLKDVSETNDWGLTPENEFVPLHVTPKTRIIGLDPGRRNLYDAVAPTSVGLVHLKCTNSRWREMSGAKHGEQKRRLWTSLDLDLKQRFHATPTPKCSSLAEYQKFLCYFLQNRDDFLGFYRAPKWRRLRFKTRITRQKAYDQ